MHLEGITMSHAGTMDLGRKTQARPGGTRLPAVMLALAAIVATIAVAWFVTKPGVQAGTAATPAADRSFDQIEAQRGAIALSAARNAYLNGIFDGAHATPFAATMPDNLSVRRGYAGVAATAPGAMSVWQGYWSQAAVTLPDNLSARRGYSVEIESPAFSAISGTFHPGKAADDRIVVPLVRDRIGGP